MAASTASSQLTRFDLPGFTLPLNYTPDQENPYDKTMFPNALDYTDIDGGYISGLRTFREITMMQVMNVITDKPEWDRKVFDEEITSKWRKEISDSGRDVTPKMMDWVIDELKYKAKILQETGMVTAFDPGVVKSDTAISHELQSALKEAVRPLEDVPAEKKDYHPGSDMKVVDLVHPSLFPVIYGRSRIIKDEVIGLDDCLARSGHGEVLPVPPEEEAEIPEYDGDEELQPFSRKFQWLPCDVEFEDGGECRVVSYINNLHPHKNRELYEVIQKILARTIPLWDKTLTEIRGNRSNRIKYRKVEYLPGSTPEPQPEDGENDPQFWEQYEKWESSRPIKLPEPGDFKPPSISPESEVNLRKKFGDKGIQVIVKLANIELTPETPEYEGGSWHVEGQLNEHICATAIYYYSSENITPSTLSFRQRADSDDVNGVGYQQDRHEFLWDVFGFGDETDSRDESPITQELGSVSCIEGRLLTFPNTLQHRVSPFELADRSKPGHRKILAFFLVDPHLRIISSANIPPQRADWWEERLNLRRDVLAQKLPPELQEMVIKNLDDFPITMEEAKQYRLELMEERSAASQEQNEKFEVGAFSLCEH
ncbi:hypothetical protein VTN77DRAFT_5151 [Rasamsonia byssochlamydoides]|uniref:uncharacterized protein n=1 Tax=Rasamsonia byssochlamydoides TaxID=89139 RepID=UPI003743620C